MKTQLSTLKKSDVAERINIIKSYSQKPMFGFNNEISNFFCEGMPRYFSGGSILHGGSKSEMARLRLAIPLINSIIMKYVTRAKAEFFPDDKKWFTVEVKPGVAASIYSSGAIAIPTSEDYIQGELQSILDAGVERIQERMIECGFFNSLELALKHYLIDGAIYSAMWNDDNEFDVRLIPRESVEIYFGGSETIKAYQIILNNQAGRYSSRYCLRDGNRWWVQEDDNAGAAIDFAPYYAMYDKKLPNNDYIYGLLQNCEQQIIQLNDVEEEINYYIKYNTIPPIVVDEVLMENLNEVYENMPKNIYEPGAVIKGHGDTSKNIYQFPPVALDGLIAQRNQLLQTIEETLMGATNIEPKRAQADLAKNAIEEIQTTQGSTMLSLERSLKGLLIYIVGNYFSDPAFLNELGISEIFGINANEKIIRNFFLTIKNSFSILLMNHSSTDAENALRNNITFMQAYTGVKGTVQQNDPVGIGALNKIIKAGEYLTL